MVPMFSAVFKAAGVPALATVARLNVTELGLLAPGLIVCDIDDIDVDPLELLRRIRFVLPLCVIAVFTGATGQAWGMSCHLAGANCLLSKGTTEHQLALGLRVALRSGCFTDPSFAA